MAYTFVIGDIHGQLDKLSAVLRRTKLVDDHLMWIAGSTQLVFLGDFFDRGPDGIGAVDLIMRLQGQARAVGGNIHALLGNHDALFLAVSRFSNNKHSRLSGLFIENWLRNGGRQTDLERLKPHHLTWLLNLPVMTLIDDRLMVHADAFGLYTGYGRNIESVNQAFARLLSSHDEDLWEKMLGDFSERMSFLDDADMGINGAQTASQFLRMYGGLQIVHGHTPITKIINHPPEEINRPLVYANGLCINVDGGMYMGGPGFAYRLPTGIESVAATNKNSQRK